MWGNKLRIPIFVKLVNSFIQKNLLIIISSGDGWIKDGRKIHTGLSWCLKVSLNTRECLKVSLNTGLSWCLKVSLNTGLSCAFSTNEITLNFMCTALLLCSGLKSLHQLKTFKHKAYFPPISAKYFVIPRITTSHHKKIFHYFLLTVGPMYTRIWKPFFIL